MEKEQFNPKDEQYKEVANLPPENQEEFMDVKGGGFVGREAIINVEKAEDMAHTEENERESKRKEKMEKEKEIEILARVSKIVSDFLNRNRRWVRAHIEFVGVGSAGKQVTEINAPITKSSGNYIETKRSDGYPSGVRLHLRDIKRIKFGEEILEVAEIINEIKKEYE